MRGKMTSALFVAATLLAILPTAQAERFVRLGSDALQDTLFGVHLYGELARTGIAWDECITPEGDTVYRYDGETSVGKLTITSRAQACFAYGEGFPSCFDVYRAGDRLLLSSGTMEFMVTRIETGITRCSGPAAIS